MNRLLFRRSLHKVIDLTVTATSNKAHGWVQSWTPFSAFGRDNGLLRRATLVGSLRGLPLLRRLQTESNMNKTAEICVLYKGRWMMPFYLLVRLKILQLVGFAACAIPINAYFAHGTVDLKVMVSSLFVMVGSGVASTSMWFFSKRYVGALALVGSNQDTVRFSVMNFWGNRMEDEYSLDSVIPPLRGLSHQEQRDWLRERVLIPIDVIGGRQYFISVKHGYILNKDMLLRLLDGRHLRDVTDREVKTKSNH